MKYLFVLVFISVFILFGTELGYTNTSPFYTHFTYLFQHSSILHLVLNSISFIALFTMLDEITSQKVFLVISFTIGIVSSFLAMYAIPTVGVSSVIYAMIGLYLGLTLFYKDIRIADTRRYLLNISLIAISLTISLIKTSSNFYIHVYSLIMAFAVSILLAYLHNKKIKTSDD